MPPLYPGADIALGERLAGADETERSDPGRCGGRSRAMTWGCRAP